MKTLQIALSGKKFSSTVEQKNNLCGNQMYNGEKQVLEKQMK